MDDDDFEGSDDPSNPSNLKTEDRRLRREIANSNERKRMQSINAGFETLKSLLPGHQQGERMSKAAVLQQTVELVNGLQVELSRVGAALIHSRRRECQNNGCCSAATASDAMLAVTTTVGGSLLPENNVFNDRRRDSTDAETEDCDNTTGSLHESSHNDSVVCNPTLLHPNSDEIASENVADARRLSACTNASVYTSTLTTAGSIAGGNAKRKLDAALLDENDDDLDVRFDEDDEIKREQASSSTGASPMPLKNRNFVTLANPNEFNPGNLLLPSISFDAAPPSTTAATTANVVAAVPVLSDGIRSDQGDEQQQEKFSIRSSGKSPVISRSGGGGSNACSYLFDIEAITLQVVELRRELDKERRARMRLEEECRRRKLEGPLCAECANKRGRTSRNLAVAVPTTNENRSASGLRAGSSAERSSSSLAMLSGGGEAMKKHKNMFETEMMPRFDAVNSRKPSIIPITDENPANTLSAPTNLVLNVLPNGTLSFVPANFSGANKVDSGLAALRRSSLGFPYQTTGGGAIKSEMNDPMQLLLSPTSIQQQPYDLSSLIARRQSVDSANASQQQPTTPLLLQPAQFAQQQQYLMTPKPSNFSAASTPMVRAVALDINGNHNRSSNSLSFSGSGPVMRLLPSSSNLISSFVMPSSSVMTMTSAAGHQQYAANRQQQPILISNSALTRTFPTLMSSEQQQAVVLAALQQQQQQQTNVCRANTNIPAQHYAVIQANQHHHQRSAINSSRSPLTPSLITLNSNSNNLQNLFIYNVPSTSSAAAVNTTSMFIPPVSNSMLNNNTSSSHSDDVHAVSRANLLTSLPASLLPYSAYGLLPPQHLANQQVSHHHHHYQVQAEEKEPHEDDQYSDTDAAVDDEADSEIQEIYNKNSASHQSIQHNMPLNDFDALLASSACSIAGIVQQHQQQPTAMSFINRPNLLFSSSSTDNNNNNQSLRFMPTTNLGFKNENDENESSSVAAASAGGRNPMQWLLDAGTDHHHAINQYVADQQQHLNSDAFIADDEHDPSNMTDFDQRVTSAVIFAQQQQQKNVVEHQNLQQHNNNHETALSLTDIASAATTTAAGHGLGTLLEAIYHIESNVVEQPLPLPSTATISASSSQALTPVAPTITTTYSSPKKRIQAAVFQQQQQLLQASIANSSTALVSNNAAADAVIESAAVPSTTIAM